MTGGGLQNAAWWQLNLDFGTHLLTTKSTGKELTFFVPSFSVYSQQILDYSYRLFSYSYTYLYLYIYVYNYIVIGYRLAWDWVS